MNQPALGTGRLRTRFSDERWIAIEQREKSGMTSTIRAAIGAFYSSPPVPVFVEKFGFDPDRESAERSLDAAVVLLDVAGQGSIGFDEIEQELSV